MSSTISTWVVAGLICGATLIASSNDAKALSQASDPPGAQSGSAPMPSQATSADNELLLAGEPVIVTATKTAQPISDSPEATTIITEEDIARSGATTVPELLRSVPGVDVESPNSSQDNVSIRGFNFLFANKVLVLVDGRSLNSPIQGSIFWNTEPLLISQIKRIEIVRGPGSVLYGANAFSGIINIITKTPQEILDSKKTTSLVAAYGEHNSSFVESAFTGGRSNGLSGTLGVGYHGSDGFEVQRNQIQDVSQTPIVTGTLQKQLSRGSLVLDANAAYSRASLTVVENLPDAIYHTDSASLSYTEDRGANPIAATIYGSFLRLSGTDFFAASDEYNLDIQQQRSLSAQQTLTYGINDRLDEFKTSVTNPAQGTEHLFGLFAQDQYNLGRATNLFAGVRFDHQSVYGTQVSPRISMVHHLDHLQTLRLSYGSAFRAPSEIENYTSISVPLGNGFESVFNGNKELKPEKIASLEGGYRKDISGGYIGASVYYNQITGLIDAVPLAFEPSPPFPSNLPSLTQYENAGNAHAIGTEIEGDFRLRNGWKVQANYSYEDIQETAGQPVDLSPRNKANLIIESDSRIRWSWYEATHYVSAETYEGAVLRAYTTVDARVRYRFGTEDAPWTLGLSATNLLDDHHEELANNVTEPYIAVPQFRTLWLMISTKR